MPNSDYKDIKIIVDHRKNGATICWKNYYINGQRGGFKERLFRDLFKRGYNSFK